MPAQEMQTSQKRVLLTNNSLSARAGTECTIRDLSIGLLNRGHRPIVYSPTLGSLSEEIRVRGIPVIDDLRLLAEAPDIVHGHHFIPTAEALIHFPSSPALFVCHAWEYWMERPPRFPQIQMYGAVSEAVRDRLVHSEGIEPSAVIVLLNAVDLSRVPPRTRELSRQAKSALCFTARRTHVPVLRTACEQLGIQLSTLGNCGNRVVGHPERELIDYDVVFATGRSAIEALCAGAAVIVCDSHGLGGLVTSENYSSFRRLNFALRSLVKPISVETIVAELRTFNVDDAARVSELARSEVSLDTQLDRLLAIYDSIISTWQQAHTKITAESRNALLDFLHEALPRKITDPRWPWQLERDQLVQKIDYLDKECASLQSHLSDERSVRRSIAAQLSKESASRVVAEQGLRQVHQSHSWRITAPLRWLKDTLSLAGTRRSGN